MNYRTAAARDYPTATGFRSLLLGVRIAAFLAMISLPALGLLLRGSAPDASFENRRLAEFPTGPWTKKALREFPTRFEAYFGDHIAFRNELIRWNNYVRVVALKDNLGGSVVGAQGSALAGSAHSHVPVVAGRDGWLYFTGDSSLESCRCMRPFSNEELATLTRVLEERRDWLAAQGIEYMFCIASDKHTVYPEYLPASLKRVGAKSRLEQFIEHMAAHSTVNVVDLTPPLMQAKPQGQLYYKSDTHWNELGAFVGYQAMMEEFRKIFPDLTPTPLSSFEMKMQKGFSGDMAMMAGLEDVFKETTPLLIPKFPFTWKGGPLPGSSIAVTHCAVMENSDGPRALFMHDSFMGYQIRFLQPHFSRATWLATRDFDPDLIQQERPDIVVEEVVERRLMRPFANPPQLTTSADRWAARPNSETR